MLATKHNKKEVVKALVKGGADVEHQKPAVRYARNIELDHNNSSLPQGWNVCPPRCMCEGVH